MASLITKKRGNTWEYRFEAAPVNNKRRQISKGGFRTKAEAIAAGSKAMAEYNTTGDIVRQSNISVADFLSDWQKSYCVTLKDTTQANYDKKIRLYINPAIGGLRLSAVTPDTLQKFLFSLYNNGYSKNTITDIKCILSGAFRYAVKYQKILQSNPASELNINFSATPKTPTRHKKHDFIPRETEWSAIMSRFPFGTTAHIPLLLGYRCGLRLGEAFAVMWDDIDFEAGTLTISRQMQHKCTSIELLAPKYNSYRAIQIDDHLLQVLKETKAQQDALWAGYAKYFPHYYLARTKADGNEKLHGELLAEPIENCEEVHFVNLRNDGSFVQDRIIQHTSRVIHTQLGMRNFDFHSLRHAHATILIENGALPKDVQNRLGHKNIKVTMEIYTKLTKEMETKSVSILNQMPIG